MIVPGNEHFRVAFDQLSEIAEETVGWLQKLKLRVSLFPLCETLEKLLPILCHKLGGKFDNFTVDVG